MKKIKGNVDTGCGHMGPRLTDNYEKFKECIGTDFHKGTLNIKIDKNIEIKEDCKLSAIDVPNDRDPGQDYIFEKCKVTGKEGYYRIVPFKDGKCRGHGNDTLEIVGEFIPDIKKGDEIEIEFYRDI